MRGASSGQLHQLRGRVGRVTRRASVTCSGPPTTKRGAPSSLVDSNDGFALASGLDSVRHLLGAPTRANDLRLANLRRDEDLLIAASQSLRRSSRWTARLEPELVDELRLFVDEMSDYLFKS